MGARGGRRHGGFRHRLIAVVLVGAAALSGCSSDRTLKPPPPPASSTAAHEVSAERTLRDLVRALQARSASGATSLGTSDARSTLEAMVANARVLDLRDLSMRFVDEQSVLGEDDRQRYGSDAWAGTVDLSYRIDGWDSRPTRLETRFVFVTKDGRAELAGVGGGDARTPLWTTGRLTTFAAGRVLVVTTGDSGPRYLAFARHALVDVAKVLPGWHGRLVIEAPASEEQLDEALDAPQEQYANIAAVTTTVDGSLVPGSPVHVFLNPRVFDGLGPRGAQVVVSHETTHVATGATFAELPTWLLEGFADYVALAHAGIPVATAASQILARVRKEGPPDHLPSAAELDPTANGLGATYEEAWLATRFIAREYGEPKLVSFYQAVSGGEAVATAFKSVLGTNEEAFVRRWRADVRDLAGGVAG